LLDNATLIWIAGAALGCFVIEKLTLAYSLNQGLLSQPNARSSHSRPTPSIGGIAIVVPVLIYCLCNVGSDARLLVIFFAVLLLAMSGLWDDLRPLSSRLRFALQILVVVFSLIYLHIDFPFESAVYTLSQPWLWQFVLAVGILWCINLFNFMDGIDGLAAAQCLVYCLACIIFSENMPPEMARLIWVLGSSALVFLWFNWPPASIFMGDVGSAALGYLIAIIALLLDHQEVLPMVASMILFSVFWIDASFTLAARMFSGQAFASAHRSHLYQKLAVRYGHRRVSTIFCFYALLVLFPLAGGAISYPSWGIIALGLACVPVIVLCIWYRAGLPEQKS